MKTTRRFFLKSSGALAACSGLAPFDRLLAGLAGIRPVRVKQGRTLVVVFLRGGVDGLNLVVPFGDPAYYELRSYIAIQRPGQQPRENSAVDLDGFFGLHPRAAALQPLFAAGDATALQAVGHPNNSRSHFEEQDVWETGVEGNTVSSDGWLNRHLATSEGDGPIRAVSIGDSLPRILRGDQGALALRGLEDLAFSGSGDGMARVVAALERAYARPGGKSGAAGDILSQGGRTTLEALEELQKVAAQPYQSEVEYPQTEIGQQLREVARLIKAGIGLEVAEVDYGGWDTHQNEGGAFGPFADLVGGLSDALLAFHRDLESRMDDVLVLTLSEFGRTAAQNGTGGTDHGWGNCMLALGGPVRRASGGDARPVLGGWPGLARDALHEQRDLAHTTDFRDVLAEVVRVHLGNPNLERVLPGREFQPVGLV